MANEEASVREAAKAFHEAIVHAEKAGYRVDLPSTKEGLQNVNISEGGKRFVEEIVLREATPEEIVGTANADAEVAAKRASKAEKAPKVI